MRQIFLITDYNNRFGTKYTASPYRSGMNKEILREEFLNSGFEPVFLMASDVLERAGSIKDSFFLYTSSEDRDHHYKSFLEDLVLSLTEMKGIVIPRFLYLRAHNNKVMMELLRKEWGMHVDDILRSLCFGSYEEMISQNINLAFPLVVKRPEGFKSRGVYLAENMVELKRIAFRISRSFHTKDYLKDRIRTFIHDGFIPESHNRKKFVIQEFIPGLTNDWKILIYGDKYFPLFRHNRKNDFRASGSGLLSYPDDPPRGLLDFAEKTITWFDVPSISLDVAFDGTNYYLLEVQFLYFGTYTIEHSEFCFRKKNETWEKVNGRSVLELEYVRSIVMYLNKGKLHE